MGFRGTCLGESESVSCSVMFDSFWIHGLYSLSGSSVHGILQARAQKWVAIPISWGSSWPRPRDQAHVSCFAGRFFTIWATRDALSGLKGKSILPSRSGGDKDPEDCQSWNAKSWMWTQMPSGSLLKCKIWFGRSGVGPEILHPRSNQVILMLMLLGQGLLFKLQEFQILTERISITSAFKLFSKSYSLHTWWIHQDCKFWAISKWNTLC